MGMKGKPMQRRGKKEQVVCVHQSQVRFLLFFGPAQPFFALALFAVFDALALLRSPSQ